MTQRFTREDWLDLGLALLSAHGPDALKLDRITSEAGRTKGSFYHHFQDHTAFLLAMAERWREVATERFIRDIDLSQMDEPTMRQLVEGALEIDLHLEINIRDLGRAMPQIGAAIAETDARRLGFATMVYQWRFDLDEVTARDLALLDYGAFAGIVLMNPSISLEDRTRLYSLFDELLLARFGQKTSDGT